MKASVRWLRSLLPELEASTQEIADRLSRSGLEVEDVHAYGAASRDVLVAEVRKVERHPDRDKLSLVTVDRGRGDETVVCGAPNVPAPGGRVVLAPLGTKLPAVGLEVAPREIGGIVSQGMLCSEEELGLTGAGGRGDGIIVLGDLVGEELGKVALGTPLSLAFGATSDQVLEISVTPNRPDALGHVGLARELAAIFGLPFVPPSPDAPARVQAQSRIADLASVTIEDTERCPHYGAAVVVDVAVGRSPDWLRYRLESLGLRAISNVVDVTNLVLLEFGHPLHAFDLDRLPGTAGTPRTPVGRIVVRRARDGERMTTLDGVERTLVNDDLLITDGARGVALAGVMGGQDSEISDGTRRVLLECAYFEPRGIRRSARRHGLHSEASHRFERGCDPEAVPDVLAHAAALMTRLCSAAAVPGSILAGVPPAPRRRVRLRQSKMDALLGLPIALDRAGAILERLGCGVARSAANAPPAERAGELDVTAPSFRPDIAREEDLIEEVMRIHGIDQVPTTLRAVTPVVGRSEPTIEERARQAAADLGLSEALCFGFVAPEQLAKLGAAAACVRIENPLSEERSVMRTTLLIGLLEALRRARRHGVPDVRLFTVGRTFFPCGDLPDERVGLAAILAGERTLGLAKPEAIDLYDAKGVAMEIVERVSRRPATTSIVAEGLPHLHPRGRAGIAVGETRVGSFGPLHPDVVNAFDLDGPAFVIELDIDALGRVGRSTPQFRNIPALPPVTRDVALVVSEDVTAGTLTSGLHAAAGDLCESVELFDLFKGKGIPDDHRSLAFRLVFRDPAAARTLTDQEVDARMQKVTEALPTWGARLR